MRNIKWFFAFVLVIVFLVISTILFFAFSVKIEPWYVWIKVNLYGSEQWVNSETIKAWRTFYNSITHDIYKFPVHIQQKTYNSSFQDKEWLTIWSAIWIDFKFDPNKVNDLYEEYRASASRISSEYMQTWLRNTIVSVASEYNIDEIYWLKKEEFRLNVLDKIKVEFEEKWILVDNVYLVGDMVLPAKIIERINTKIEATQEAIQRENELRITKAETEKKIETARWEAESVLVKAEAEAEAITLKAQAEANAHKLLNESLTQNIIEMKKVEKWDWTLPTVSWTEWMMLNLWNR